MMAFFGFCSLANGQQAVDAGPSEPPESIVRTIDFQLTPHNNLVVKAILNETDSCDLMFHTAVDSVSLIAASTPKLKSVQFTHEVNAIAWGGEQAARYSPKNKIQIGDRVWSNIAIAEDRHSGIGTDGKFGWELFEGQVVEIDFDDSQIKVHSKLPDLTGYAEFKTKYDRGGMKIECAIDVGGKNVSHRFLVHSGFSGTALFDDQFTATHKLHDRWQSSPGRDLKDSLGNVISTSRVVIPSISIGESQLKDVPAELFPGNIRSQKVSVIGSDLLKRFNFVVDADREHIYLKPNRNFATKFPTTH